MTAAPTAPSVSVVVCTYSQTRWALLERCLASLRTQSRPPEEILLVVDHNPGLLDRARRSLSGVTVLANEDRRGLAGARNTGVHHAGGEVVAFLDDDARAAPDWLAQILTPYADPDVLGVGSRICPDWEQARPRWLAEEFDWVVGCSYRGLPERPAPVRNLIGAAMSFRRGALTAAGGFDEGLGRLGTLPAGCEETEACIRLGARHPEGVLLYFPAARVRHHVPASRATGRYFLRRCYAEGRSKALVARRVGSTAALASERVYVRHTLPRAAAAGLRDGLSGDPTGLQRVAMIVVGLAVTSAGYLSAAVQGSYSGTAQR